MCTNFWLKSSNIRKLICSMCTFVFPATFLYSFGFLGPSYVFFFLSVCDVPGIVPIL